MFKWKEIFAEDTLAHFVVSAALVVVPAITCLCLFKWTIGDSLVSGICVSFICGICKEFYDARHGGHFCTKDLMVNIVSITLTSGLSLWRYNAS